MDNLERKEISRKNHRVDAFLKRNLSSSEYETLRGFEPCVIVSEKEKHVFRYIVLSSKNVYFTENPPKTIQLLANLSDIISIQMIYDLPNFLSGDDREKCQHLRLHYAVNGSMLSRSSESASFSGLEIPRADHGSDDMSKSMPNSVIHQSSDSNKALRESWKHSLGTRAKIPIGTYRQLPMPTTSQMKDADNKPVTELTTCLPKTSGKKKLTQPRNLSLSNDQVTKKVTSVNDIMDVSTLAERSQRRTLEMDPKFTRKVSVSRTSKNLTEQQLQLFNQLKEEILSSTKLEETYVLLQELNTACMRNYSLKKLFWKTPDLFGYISKCLAQFMITSSQATASSREPNSRADELELCLVFLEVVGNMFRETEVISSRISVLKMHKGQMLLKLIESVIARPLSRCPQNYSVKFQKYDIPMLRRASENTVEDNEAINLEKEVTDAAASLLFEIILATQQMKYWSDAAPGINLWWLVKFLESKQDWTENFIKRMTDAALEKLSTASDHSLSPQGIVGLYQKFTVLNTMIQSSKLLSEFIKCTYVEEFKSKNDINSIRLLKLNVRSRIDITQIGHKRYFVKAPLLRHLLLEKYPLSFPTQKLIITVMKFVLERSKSDSS